MGSGMEIFEAGPSSGELRVSFEGRDITVRPGQTVRIGRAPDNDLVVNEPTVSRQHAVLRWGDGWQFENAGSAPTFLNGGPVTRVTVDRPLRLALGSANGPALHLEPATAAAPPTALQPAGGYQPPPPPGPAYPPAPPAGAAYPSSAWDAGYLPPSAAGYPPPPGAAGYQRAPGAGWGPVPPPGRAAAAGPAGPSGDEMATALRILFPLQSWLHDAGWRQGLRVLVIVYALLPLIFLALLSSSSDLSAPGWAYSLYIAPLWAMGFWMLIRPGRVGKQELLAGAGIVLWTLAWMNTVTININTSLHTGSSIGFFPALVIGFNEEITKALPVLLAGLILLRYRSVKLSVRMSMFLGTIAGLTFGVFEQAFYTSSDIIVINQAQSANEAVNAALAFAERIFVDGFEHAVWAGIAGFFIGMAVNYRRRRVLLIALGVAVPAVLHALNDFLAGSSIWLVILVQGASLLLFLGYTMSAASIEERVRQSPLFRGDSLIVPAYRDPDGPLA
jgi:RsiW-degrading membrane proteinase PrsW (M82 family)